jgi:hypothetical protein
MLSAGSSRPLLMRIGLSYEVVVDREAVQIGKGSVVSRES